VDSLFCASGPDFAPIADWVKSAPDAPAFSKGEVQMFKLLRHALLLLSLCAAPAFAKSDFMQPAADTAPSPQPGKALVVFFRTSFYGQVFSATLYEAPDDATRFLGAMDNKTKLAVQMEPGKHRFMVVAENADFLDAELDAGKTYYVLISPRTGFMKMRFSLFPMLNQAGAKYSLLGPEFKEWMSETRFVSKGPEADAWYEDNKDSVAKKKAAYLVKWNKMDAPDRAELVLHAEDGIVAK